MTQWSAQMIDPYVNENIKFSGAFKDWNALNTCFSKDGFPGIIFIAGHVVFGMVAGDRHKGQ